MDYDVIIIGGGVVGSAIARFLSRYSLKLALYEKTEDICSGTSKANSGIVHSGYDPEPGTAKARFNIRGAELIRELAPVLNYDYIENGSLIIAERDVDYPKLEELYQRGLKNGVQGMKLLNQAEVRALEPNINDNVTAALLCPTGGIICPFSLTEAMAENAADNGASFFFEHTAVDVEHIDGGYKTTFADGSSVTSRAVVNAAGLYSDYFHNKVSANKIKIIPGRGNYFLCDKEVGSLVSHTVFQLPTELGKGVLVTPTAHGNLMVGPTSVKQESKEDTATYAEDFASIRKDASRSVKQVPFNKVITSFSGIRAHEEKGDFIIGEVSDSPFFFDAAGIDSPGLTSAPAIGEYLSDLIAERLGLKKNDNFKPERKGFVKVASLPLDERRKLIEENPLYGVIVCRCEEISEGEIRDAIRRNPGARSLDGVKRRVRAGMGRCQAGFCMPRTMEILAEELGVPMEKIAKNKKGSEVLYEA